VQPPSIGNASGEAIAGIFADFPSGEQREAGPGVIRNGRVGTAAKPSPALSRSAGPLAGERSIRGAFSDGPQNHRSIAEARRHTCSYGLLRRPTTDNVGPEMRAHAAPIRSETGNDRPMPAAQRDNHEWLSEPTVHGVFMRFPMSIAMIGKAGNVELANERFTRLFDTAILTSDELRGVAGDPGRSWQSVHIPCRDGHVVDAWAQALTVEDGVMLVVDEAGASRSAPGMEELRARIARLERDSASDHLTGAWNRAHLDRSIAAEIARSSRLKQPISLVLIDIDHFKRINDTYGHQAGDSVLRELVTLCQAHIRKADVLFRWGGEEFVILATSTGYRHADVLAQALRKRVEQHAFDVVGALTISLGVAEHFEWETGEDWFRRLDKALYRAKAGGRNRVSVDPRGDSDVWAAQSGRSALRLVWLEAYECGEPTIDREHRDLFDLANTVIDASLATDTAPRVFQAALDTLLEHLERHFCDEEALLEKHNYAKLGQHKAAHAHLLARARELRSAAQSATPMLGALVDFLANDVVSRHLFTADRDFFPLFSAR
jgi:diguanylate cyclase (GGDEF)-like protein/hemerythrin-like metal-binding protein